MHFEVLIDHLIASGTLTTLAARRFSQVSTYTRSFPLKSAKKKNAPRDFRTPPVIFEKLDRWAFRWSLLPHRRFALASYSRLMPTRSRPRSPPRCSPPPSGSTWRHTLGTGRILWICALDHARASYCADTADSHHNLVYLMLLWGISERLLVVCRGVSNTIGNIPGIYGNLLTGWVLQCSGSWFAVFAIAIVHWIVGAGFYVACSSAEPMVYRQQRF